MKKKLMIISSILLSFACNVAYGEKIGTVIKKVLFTDIKAYVNGYEIPSMNIDGNTAIVVEHLRNYGFDVIWNPSERSLSIQENPSKEMSPIEINNNEIKKVGEKIGDVLSTDIKTFVNGKEVKSFNIGGYTAMFINELKEWGSITWNEEKREVKFTSNNLHNNENKESESVGFKIEKVNTVELNIEYRNNNYYYEGKKVGFMKDKAMLSLKFLANKFNYDFSMNNGSYIGKKGSYSFKINIKDNKVQQIFDGIVVKEFELPQNYICEEDIFLPDTFLVSLFGLNKQWNIDTKSIHLKYTEFTIKDYGNYEVLGNEFIISAVSDVSDSNISIEVFNKSLGYGGTSFGYYNQEKLRYETESKVPLGYLQNDLNIAVVYEGRILIYKTMEDVLPDIKTHRLENEKAIGPFTSMKIISPTEGYVETNKNQIEIKGEIRNVNDNTLYLEIEKINLIQNTFEKIDDQNLSIINGSFDGNVNLQDGFGVYKISGYVNINGLHGKNAKVKAFEFFVNYYG